MSTEPRPYPPGSLVSWLDMHQGANWVAAIVTGWRSDTEAYVAPITGSLNLIIRGRKLIKTVDDLTLLVLPDQFAATVRSMSIGTDDTTRPTLPDQIDQPTAPADETLRAENGPTRPEEDHR